MVAGDTFSGPLGGLPAERRSLVERLRADRAGPRPRDRGARAPLSYAQEQLWLVHQLLGPAALSSAPLLLRLRGAFDGAAFHRAVAALVARHEVLRTTVEVADGEPLQAVHPPPFLDYAEADLSGSGERDLTARAAQETRAGFDLRTGPLLRVRVYRLGPDDHAVLFARHHLVFDASSDAVLLAELAELYRAEVAGTTPGLPEPAPQYADYAIWERERLTGERLDGLLAYWRERLAGVRPLAVPGARPRPPLRDGAGGFLSTRVPGEVSERLADLAQAERLTPFMLLLALLRVVLWRATGRRDVLVGTPMTGRTRPETQGMLGYLLNMVVLRNPIDGEPSVRRLAAAEREAVLGAYEHAELPYILLTRELGRAAVPLQVTFSYDVADAPPPPLPGLTVTVLDPGLAAAQYDLEVKVVADGDGLAVHWAYDEAIHDRALVDRLAEAYLATITAAVARPDGSVGDLPAVELGPPADPSADAGPGVAAEPGRSPSGLLEEQIAELWGELLEIDPPGAEADLFALGGHSLTVAKLAYRLELDFGLTVSVADLFTHPTVAGQAALIEERLRERLAALGDRPIEELLGEPGRR